jgi:CDP-diacylglycerol--serine O-phosphatidyltransferase
MIKRFPIIPTLVTLGNLFCGFIAMGFVLKAQAPDGEFGLCMRWAGWMILAAMVFDALDGKVARLSKATSEFGMQLDSLCDMVSFGVAPGLVIKALAQHQHYAAKLGWMEELGWATSVFFVMCVALRLARFNVGTAEDEASHREFTGLPSPAGAAFVAALVILYYRLRSGEPTGSIKPLAEFLQPAMNWMLYAMPVLAAVVGGLMISNVRYVHVMNRLTREREPLRYVVLLVLVGMLVFFTHPFSMAVLMIGYVAGGPAMAVRHRLREAAARPAPSEGEP